MTASSTANSRDPGGPVKPTSEKGVHQENVVRPVVKGEVSPRLPHERDESFDSGSGAPTEVMKRAGEELDAGHRDDPRGPATQRRYTELTEKARKSTP